MNEKCASLQRELWACWPQTPRGPAAREALAHAAQCPECRAELAALRALNRASSSAGRTLGWSEVYPRRRWRGLAWSTRRALGAPAKKMAAPLPVPAFAAAALATVLLLTGQPKPGRHVSVSPPAPVPAPAEPAPPAQSLDELDMLAHLDLLENWGAAAAPQASPETAP